MLQSPSSSLLWRVLCDYTFMQEVSDTDKDLDSDDEKEDQHEGNRCIRHLEQDQSLPSPIERITRFSPPEDTDTPQSLFVPAHRFIRRSNEVQILVYTDGACANNGQPSATAGCAFVFRPSSSTASINGTVSFPLEKQGPSGVIYPPTSNRAELRAVIAALQFRAWHGEGWTELVIATDSEYVVSGATAWIRGWLRTGWMTGKKTPVKNRDLWELLLQRIEDLPLRVLFWRIPRDWNRLADAGAKAAALQDAPTEFLPIHGVLV